LARHVTVWTWRRLLRTDRFKSPRVANSRLCVARRHRSSSFQKRSMMFSYGL
jgi:hypothetical protein